MSRSRARRILLGGGGSFQTWLNKNYPGTIMWHGQDLAPSTTMLAVYNSVLNSAYDGTYSGVTLGQSFAPGNIQYAGSYDGSNDYTDIYSAALNSVFDGDEYTIMIFAKADPAMLTDGTVRYSFILRVDGNNQAYIARTAIDNQFRFANTAGGAVKEQTIQIPGAAERTYFAVTNSKSAGATGEIKIFINSVQQGSTLTGLGSWAGGLSSTETLIGARSTAGNSVYHGEQTEFLINPTRAMTPTEITDIGNRSGVY